MFDFVKYYYSYVNICYETQASPVAWFIEQN